MFFKRKKKILLTGGGTGGHIYPLLAVADEISEIDPNIDLSYIGPHGHLTKRFSERNIRVFSITSAKLRRYFSIDNILDVFKFFFSIFEALFKVFLLTPDVVFSKGGPGSFPIVLAARMYFIPVIIHESDAVPSLNSRWSSRIAKRIGISFEVSSRVLPKDKTFLSGNPIRKSLLVNLMNKREAKRYFKLDPQKTTLLVIGGSQGAVPINNFIISELESLLSEVQIIHQVGDGNLDSTMNDLYSILPQKDPKNYFKENLEDEYKIFENLNEEDLKKAFAASDLVISRAGSGSIFELAALGKPSIIIPLDGSANDHQRANAYEYTKTGAAILLEQNNLKKNILLSLIKDLLEDKDRLDDMANAAISFSKPNAANIVAKEIMKLI